MAYNIRKIAAYGATGIVIALSIIIAFIPTQKEVGVSPTVNMQEIPGFGVNVIKITDEQADLINLIITIKGIEVKQREGNWTKIDIPEGGVSIDLLRPKKHSIIGDASKLAGNYSNVRLHIAQGLEYSNATLDNGDIINVDISDEIEVAAQTFEVKAGSENILLELEITPVGPLANYILHMQHQIAIMTMKISVTATL